MVSSATKLGSSTPICTWDMWLWRWCPRQFKKDCGGCLCGPILRLTTQSNESVCFVLCPAEDCRHAVGRVVIWEGTWRWNTEKIRTRRFHRRRSNKAVCVFRQLFYLLYFWHPKISALSTTHVLKPERLNVTTNIQDDENVEIQQKLDTIGLKLGKKKRPEDCGLIVVASLVNKPTNLGGRSTCLLDFQMFWIPGLSRTLEIFNGLSLVVSNSDVINKHEFKSLSMNSEKLLSIIEVKPEDLTDYFKQCKNSGFSIVAAEQTSRSTMLNNFRFPKKTVLLLGDERMGVPAELIRYVDHTVEIPQLGVTRSLNVHVSASLFIFEHAKQHLLSDH